MRVTRNKRISVKSATGRVVRVGSIVRVVVLPPGFQSLHRESKSVFRAILGHRFRVEAITSEDPRWLQLEVGRIVDEPPHSVGNVVWLEPECVA